ncbi:hypothetical protein [Amycolatopsis pretoriensis]|uniref:hypothetical protein n=1 Tax=Amycolatopsis pretoriensis TaxID=218821 RepID=UPI00115F7F22|nr:hypothetical protein [Amycolatopsis pretoriensis]
MTVVAERPVRRLGRVVSRAEAYEWRWFIDGLHCYRLDQLADYDVYLLTPWCEEGQRFPLRHDRDSVGRGRVPSPNWAAACRKCGHRQRSANMEARRAADGR